MNAHPLVGHRVTANVTGSTVSVTGTLQPVRTEPVHPIDLGGGAEILVAPDRVTIEEDTAPRAGDGRRFLADFQDKISDEDWSAARAVHEAAHAVVGMVLGMTVEVAWVGTSRTDRAGGQDRFVG